MGRSSLAVVAVGLCASLAAGCGSSYQQAISRQSSEFLGDPYPTVMSVELVRNVNGDREAVIPMKGHFTIRPECPALAASAKTSCHAAHVRYAVLTFSLPNPRSMSGSWTVSVAQVAAVAKVRRASPLFGLFPDFTEEIVRCSIPRGGPSSGAIPGTCSTNALPYKRVRHVEFVEHWPLSHKSGSRNRAGWDVTLSRSGRVQAIHVIGHPPQLWR
jgi:hypothetical protein